MRHYFDSCKRIDYFDEKNKTFKDFLSVAFDNPNFPLKNSLRKTKIEVNERYRPDKISARLYNGNPLMSWVIDEVNNFYNGFLEYEQGREIFYPTQSALNQMGISFSYSEE